MIDDRIPQTMAMQQLQGSGAGQVSELVKRLRAEGKNAFHQKYSLGMFKLCAEAAARIEALEAALRSIAGKCPATCDMTLAHEMAEEAEAALAPEHDAP